MTGAVDNIYLNEQALTCAQSQLDVVAPHRGSLTKLAEAQSTCIETFRHMLCMRLVLVDGC